MGSSPAAAKDVRERLQQVGLESFPKLSGGKGVHVVVPIKPRADWEQVETSTTASTTLAEREGLTGKLCFPFVMRGVLHWREGDWDGAVEICRRAHEIGEQVGRSEVAFSALFWLAAALRDSGDYSGAETALSQALDVCERAGLIAQSIEAI